LLCIELDRILAMNKFLYIGVGIAVLLVGYFALVALPADTALEADSYSVHEQGFDPEPSTMLSPDISVGAPAKYTIAELLNWERPPGPPKVGIQVGHWQNESMPTELENLERNTGATWNGMTESEVMLVISRLLADQLEAAGIEVDLLPAEVPPGYVADVFLSMHADGNLNPNINGFKFAAPRRDYAGTSQALVNILYETYGAATGLRVDPSVTRRMTAYYAFNWPRYEYAVHPFTPAVIIETGFLTSAIDREVIVDQPERVAQGVADAVIAFLNADISPEPVPTAFGFPPTLPLTGDVTCAPLRAERLASADRYDCVPSITTDDGLTFILASHTSSTVSIGDSFMAVGEYIPVQNLGTYFWFPYQVNGLIVDASLPMADSWFLR
jgi:hypothetical protein